MLQCHGGGDPCHTVTFGYLELDHNMSDQRQKKRRFLSAISFPFRTPENRPPALNNVALEGPASLESLAGSHFACVNDSQTMNESSNRRIDHNTPDPPRAAMISNVERLYIGGGNFTQNIGIHDNILKHVAFQSLPRSRDAAFSAAINFNNLSRRRCTEGTRVEVIAQIKAWVNEKDAAKAPPVYWLTGLAGLGKTTVAYTICEFLEEARLPFASFFCSLQLDSRNSKLIVTTLCRDLAELYKSYAASVLSILETNSKVVDARLRIQIDELLVKPWKASIAQGKDRGLPTPVVVVDALDESDRGTEFLEELLRVIHANQLEGIKFLVTSRPDPKVVDLCKSFPPNAVYKLHEVDTTDVQNDIKKYLREALPELKDKPELVSLSQRAGGLFIYATTAVRFISPMHTSRSVSEMLFHLQAMLNPRRLTSHDDSHERLLVDELYERVLGVAFQDAGVRATRLRLLHTIVCVASRVDASVLADLANTDQDTVKKVVESLHAVLYVSSKDGCVYWYHASFPEFLFSQARARISISPLRNYKIDLFCDAPTHHGVLARRCFSVMQNSLHFNMCHLPSSYIFDSDVPELNACIDKAFSPTLRYVSRHWARHLHQSASAEDHTDDLFCGLKDFLDNKLLFWMEAMNLLGAKSECSSLLKDAESWYEKGKKRSDLQRQLVDATKFSTFFAGSPASKSTPHLYISALSMWNQDSMTWKNWRGRFKIIPSISLPRGPITIPLLTISTPLPVNCIAISSDGNQFVSGSDYGLMEVWDAKSGEQLRVLQGHTNIVSSVTFLPDGNRIVSSSYDRSVRVWDTKTGKLLRELQGHTETVTSVAFSPPNGNRVVSGSCDRSVRVWNTKTGKLLRELQGHTKTVTSVAFSPPNGNRVVSGSCDRSVRVWDTKTGELLRELQGHTGTVTSVAFSPPDGDRVVSGSYDRSVRVWDTKTGELLRVLQGHTDTVTSVAFSPDDKSNDNRVISGSRDRSVQVWDAKTGELLRELQGHINTVTEVTYSPDGNRIISGSRDRSMQVWDAKSGEQLRGPQGHIYAIASVAFSPDGNRIVSGSDDGLVCAWDAKTGKQLRELQGHIYAVTSVAFSPNGNRIVSGSLDRSMRVWDAKTGEVLSVLQGHTDTVTSVAFSPDDNRIISGSRDRSMRVWDAKTGKLLMVLRAAATVTSVAFSLDGNRIVSGSDDGSVWALDAKMGRQLRVQGHIYAVTSVTSVAFSPDGKQIVCGSRDRSVQVWDAQTGQLLKELQGHTGTVTSVAFSPRGNRVISGSYDRSARVWDTKTGELLRELQGHTGTVTSVAFSSDGNRIVSGSYDNSIRVWTNLNPDTLWDIYEDGWILSGADRLVWVPSTISNVLLHPHNMLIISRNGSATISFKQCKLGSLWHECYTP